MRFKAPARDAISAEIFRHPAFAQFEHLEQITGLSWPTFASLNQALAGARHPYSGRELAFVEQSPDLLADGLHYEQRIHARGQIATRESSWHDTFNALMWLDRRALKAAVNHAYVSGMSPTSPTHRTRAQYALTHFDEAGALVVLRDHDLLNDWDAHAWANLFWHARGRWSDETTVLLFGHALLEHYLSPGILPVAKCLVVCADSVVSASTWAADQIAAGVLLRDPQELRPLPLAGIPGWHGENTQESFYFTAPCFRARREGRRYPEVQSIRAA